MKPGLIQRLKNAVLYIFGKQETIEVEEKMEELSIALPPKNVSEVPSSSPTFNDDKPKEDTLISQITTINNDEQLYLIQVDQKLLPEFLGRKAFSITVKVNDKPMEIVILQNIIGVPLLGDLILSQEPVDNPSMPGWVKSCDEDKIIIQVSKHPPTEELEREGEFISKPVVLQVQKRDINIKRDKIGIDFIEVHSKYFKNYLEWISEWPILSFLLKSK